MGVYCAQVGILRYILQSMQGAGHAQARQNANGANEENAAAHAAPVPQLGNIPHASTGGVCTDLQIFFMGLFMSLIPSWSPVGMNAPAPVIPIQAPAPADEPRRIGADVAAPTGV